MGPGHRRVVWTSSARRDLRAHMAFVVEDSPESARRLTEMILEAARSLEGLSERGRIVPERGDTSVRELLVNRFRLIYQVTESRTAILAFIHQRQNLQINHRSMRRTKP